MVLRNPLEILEESKKDSEISCYSLRYCITAIKYFIQSTCFSIVTNPFFDTICLLTILSNCIILAMVDPTSPSQPVWMDTSDYVFQGLYTAEIVLKVLAFGFLFNQGSYLRNPWNILDFTIVFFGYLSYLSFSGGLDFKVLRTFRILRPLRTISTVDGLRLLMEALISSLPLLGDILIILSFYFIILSIAGLQLWHGILKDRCFDPNTGTVVDSRCCGSHTCGGGDCVRFIANPNYGASNYDDVFSSLLTTFQCATLENWSNVEQNVSDAFGPTATILFSLNTLVGAFFLMNFMLAVIKSRVSKIYDESRKNKGKIVRGEMLSITELQEEAEKKVTIAQVLKSKKGKNKQALLESKICKIYFNLAFSSNEEKNNEKSEHA